MIRALEEKALSTKFKEMDLQNDLQYLIQEAR
jgi:hypothetical protein